MSSNSLEELVPHSLDLRLCDPKALDALSRAASAFDREALGRICQVVRQRVLEPEFRVGVGRMDDDGWTLTAERVAAMFEERCAAAKSSRKIWKRNSCKSFRTSRPSTRCHSFKPTTPCVRACRPIGFLDSGAYRAARAQELHRIAELLDRAEARRHPFADVMWVASTAWLSELSAVVRAHAPPAAAPVFEQVQLLADEANLRGHDIAINGWYGPSTTSDLTPVAWERRA